MKMLLSCPTLTADLILLALLVTIAGCTGSKSSANMQTSSTTTTVSQQVKITGDSLPPLVAPRIVVAKSARELTLYDGMKVVRKYSCCTGSIAGDKEREGDRKTPQGQFFVCYKNPTSKYVRSLGLSYPNPEDAARGLQSGIITKAQHDALIAGNHETFAFASNEEAQALTRPDGIVTIANVDWESLWKTPLGGEIMIHGTGATRAGTAGCVGMENADILELFEAIPLGTPVTIRP